MSYAIIRNVKYKASQLNNVYRHNERKNKNYSNKDIDLNKSDLNYNFKAPVEPSYEKEFFKLREENNLKGNLRLKGEKQSNIMCEFLITSDNDFFKSIGEAETKRYFKTAYDFAKNKCGEKNIISATVHMDETTPHMHLTYIPVVKGLKKGKEVLKINASEFWKGFNSYGKLQDEFHEYVNEMGFNLERGESKGDRKHLEVEEYKIETRRAVLNNISEGNVFLDEKIDYRACEGGSFKVEMDRSEFEKLQTQVIGSKKVLEENIVLKKENELMQEKCKIIMTSQSELTSDFTKWIDKVHRALPLTMKDTFKRRATESVVSCSLDNNEDHDRNSSLEMSVMDSTAFDINIYSDCLSERENDSKNHRKDFNNDFDLDL